METFTVYVALVVKADTTEEALRIIEDRLKLPVWLNEHPWDAPYPAGTLLWFQVKGDER